MSATNVSSSGVTALESLYRAASEGNYEYAQDLLDGMKASSDSSSGSEGEGPLRLPPSGVAGSASRGSWSDDSSLYDGNTRRISATRRQRRPLPRQERNGSRYEDWYGENDDGDNDLEYEEDEWRPRHTYSNDGPRSRPRSQIRSPAHNPSFDQSLGEGEDIGSAILGGFFSGLAGGIASNLFAPPTRVTYVVPHTHNVLSTPTRRRTTYRLYPGDSLYL